jgi:signal transduction histidine kinase
MSPRHRIDTGILWIIGIGFTLTILFLVASWFLGIQGMKRAEAEAAALVAQQRISTKLIDEIQREEASLSSLFYALASWKQSDREQLRKRLSDIESEVGRTLRTAQTPEARGRWRQVRTAVEAYMNEVRRCLDQPGERAAASRQLYSLHETMVKELADLVAANYAEAVGAQRQNYQNSRESLQRSLVLLGAGLVLSVFCAAATVRIATRVFKRMRWQARELSRLSGHVLDSQEDTVRRFSRELHDELGQTLTAVEANLSAISPASPVQGERLEDCQLLVKDAISAVREMSQLLRPSILDDFGLGPALQFLVESFAQRTGIAIDADVGWRQRMSPAAETHLYRIAQEALTNCARHSKASRITVSLEQSGDRVRLRIADNGRGFDQSKRSRGFGLIGMRERMNTLGGDVEIRSTAQGVTIVAEAPIERIYEGIADPSFAS